MKLLRLLKRELSAEASSWVQKGIISVDQADRILEMYGTELPSGREKSAGYYVLLAIAALFMGLALIVLLSANWEQIPRMVRMTTLIAATLAVNCVGLHFFKQGRFDAGRIWFFSGSLVYGAAIFLIAQIYHLGEHYPDGVFYWALGVMPIALLTDSVLIMLLAGSLATLWLVLESRFGFFPSLYPLFAFGLFWMCFRQRRSLILFLLGVGGCVYFGEVVVMDLFGDGLSRFRFGVEHIYFTAGLFLLLHAGGRLLESEADNPCHSDYGLLLRLWSLRFGILTLFVLSFSEMWLELLVASRSHETFILGCTVSVLLLVGICLALSLTLRKRRGAGDWPLFLEANISSIGLTLFYAFCNLFLLYSGKWFGLHPVAVLQIITNAALLLIGIWLILKGYRTSSSTSFYMGVAILLITALLRYFDLIGDYISGALVFFVAGLVMFTTARLWKRHLLRREAD